MGATVPAGMVGKHNIAGHQSSRTVKKEGDDAPLEEKMEYPRKTGGGVDPMDPSWISPADFVEFILNHESLTEEFCYMNRSGPYEFEIVPFSKMNPNDYMTISIRGVTHYANGELDYQDLSEWQRDQEMYRKIIQIPFFREVPAMEALCCMEICHAESSCSEVLQNPQWESLCT
jgi:hypothetical protein